MGSRSGRVSCAGCDRWWKYVDLANPLIFSRWSSRCPCPASSRTTALRSRFVTSAPAGPGVFPGTRPSPSGRRPPRSAPAPAWVSALAWISRLWACPWASASTPPRHRHGIRGTNAAAGRCSLSPYLAMTSATLKAVLDVVPRRRDLRLPVINACCRWFPMTASPPLDLYSMIHFSAVCTGIANRRARERLPTPASMSLSASRRNPSS